MRRAVFGDDGWVGEQGWRQDFKTDPPTWTTIAREPAPGDGIAGLLHDRAAGRRADERVRAAVATSPSSSRAASTRRRSKVELHRKLAFPFVTLVMTLLAVPFGVSAGRHGALYGIGLGIVIALSYWILISAFVAIGKAGLLTPVLAGWAPNILVVGLAGYLFLRART